MPTAALTFSCGLAHAHCLCWLLLQPSADHAKPEDTGFDCTELKCCYRVKRRPEELSWSPRLCVPACSQPAALQCPFSLLSSPWELRAPLLLGV